MRSVLVTSIFILGALTSAIPRLIEKSTEQSLGIQITRRSGTVNPDGSVDFEALSSHVESVDVKMARGFNNYQMNTGTPHPLASHGVEKRKASDPLTDYKNYLWYGTILVGTPPKPFHVDFDTGSGDLILSASTCDSTCDGHDLWHPNSSKTSHDLHESYRLKYGDGSIVDAAVYSDTVSVAGFTARNQSLGAVETTTGFSSTSFPADGLLGMGFKSISGFDAMPVFESLLFQKQLPHPSFSFKLSRTGAELYIGGSNSSLYTGDFTFTPVTHKAYWQVEVENIMGNHETIFKNFPAVIDTGTTVIVGPSSNVTKLHRALGAKEIGDGFYSFPCDSFPHISLGFGGRSFPISASSLHLGKVSSGSSHCVSGIVGGKSSFWIIGDVFLRNVYSTFDFDKAQVGFARLARTSHSEPHSEP